MKRSLNIILILIALLLPQSIFGEEKIDITEAIEKVLKLKLSPTEVVDSAISVIDYNSRINPEYIPDGINSIKNQLLPFTQRYPELKSEQLGQIFLLYGKLLGKSGADRFAETTTALNKAMQYALKAKDHSLMGLIYYQKALSEERFGDSHKAFDYFNEAINNYRKGKKIHDLEIINCFNNQAMIYLRLSDLNGVKHIIDSLRKYAKTCDSNWRDYASFYLYTISEVYYGTLYESNIKVRSNALRDSIDKYSLAAIRLLETTENSTLKKSKNPTWNYYNRAASFINFYDLPPIDSVQYYVNKMLGKSKNPDSDDNFNFEVSISASSLLAEMWMKHGKYDEAKNAFINLLADIESSNGSKNLILDKIEVYKNLRKLSEETHNLDDALIYCDSIIKLTNLRHDNEMTSAIKDSETKYRTQETKLALSQSEAKRVNTLMWLFAAVGFLLIVIIIFVLYAERQRRNRIQKEMEFTRLRADIGRQLTREYIDGLENERRRMSSELHDGVCNDLLAIQMSLKNDGSTEKAAKLIDNCRESVRRISHELMPPEFAYASIDEVVKFFITKQSEAYAGRTELVYRSSSISRNWNQVPDNIALEVYRIVQEATGNALKHSGAKLIEVEMTLSETGLQATIKDNGKYFNSGKHGAGLESIKRRAKSINAIATMTHPIEGGTVINLNLKF